LQHQVKSNKKSKVQLLPLILEKGNLIRSMLSVLSALLSLKEKKKVA
jgi:hypothetical protein